MDAEELQESLDVMHWSPLVFSMILDVAERTVRRWLNGSNQVPEWVVTPLRAQVAAMRANPYPPRPDYGQDHAA